jgi:hypothetical protein
MYTFVISGVLLAMEAERINAIAANLQDLSQRTAELRRYL